MNKLLLLIITGCCLAEQASAQTGATGIGTTTPHASSVLDVNSNNKGVLFPRVSTTQRMAIVNPAMGLMVYDTDKRTIFLYDGTQWMPMLSGATNANIPPQIIAPSDLEIGDFFGTSVSVFGDYAIVGCPKPNAIGRAYIYFRNGGMWTQQAILTAPDGAVDDQFGAAVAINGNYAVVGAPNDDVITGIPPITTNHFDRGSIYIFMRSGNTWAQQTKLVSTVANHAQYYGYSLSIEGNQLLVGAINDDELGAAYVYQRSGTNWVLQQKLIANDAANYAKFGASVDITNNYLIIGDPEALPNGAAYIFFYNGIFWVQQEKLSSNNNFQNKGTSVSINDSIAVVGGPYYPNSGLSFAGIMSSARRTGTTWTPIGSIVSPDPIEQAHLGKSVSIFGNVVIVGAYLGAGPYPGQGTAYVYRLISDSWKFQQKINDPTLFADSFGYAVAIDGFNVIIGSPHKAGAKGGVAFLNIQ